MVLGTVHDALALLRTACTLPASPFHQVLVSTSELLLVLLSCVSNADLGHISTAQALLLYNDVQSILGILRLSADVRGVLDNFGLALSRVIGDGSKAAQEAQIVQTLQLASKADFSSLSTEHDIVTCSLVLHDLVCPHSHIEYDLYSPRPSSPIAQAILVQGVRQEL